MKFVVIGRVEPERTGVTISPPISFTLPDGGAVSVSCDASQISVTIRDAPTIQHPSVAFTAARSIATTHVNSLGFAMGRGYSVQMVQVIDESEHSFVFGVDHEKLLGFDDWKDRFHETLSLSYADVLFRFALRDYIQAMNETDECAHYCYRAVEAICSSFGTGKNKGTDWKEMHAALGTSRDEIKQTIQDFADPVRHGNWIKLDSPNYQQLDEMRILTRDILIRYMNHRQTGITH